MPIELPKGLPFAVDTWTPASALKRHRFLTHAHRDHLAGITTAGAVYASRLTVLIARHIFPQLGSDAFVEMELGAPVLVPDPDGDFTVTAFDANHCPGAVMFLFEGAFGNVLHTGDCRLTPDCIQGLPFRYITAEAPGASQAPPSCRIDYLFLDCTFAKCPLQFPAKEASIRQVINCIWEHPNAPTVYLVSDMLGQEDILIEVSRAFGSKIYVDRDKNSECYHTLSLVAPEILTEDVSSRFQVIEFPRLLERATEMLALARARQQPEPLIIRPSTQWYAHYAAPEASLKQKPALTEPMRDEFGVWHVCLTMHSSREELEQALRFLQPKWVISTTPPCLAMDLAYVKKHCFLSRLGPDDPIWKLLRIPHGNATVTGSPQASRTTVEAIKQSEEQESEDTWSAVCSQVLQDEGPVLQDFAIEVAQPVTLFGRARLGLPQDCELWKDEYESVQVAEEAKFEEELQNSNAKSFELWKDFKSDKGTAHMIDLTQAVTNELHDSATEPELQKDCESIDGIQVIDITHDDVCEHSSSRDGGAELAKDMKCNEGAEQIRLSRFEAKEENSTARARFSEICKPRESVKFTAETIGKQAKIEATEELLSEDRTVLSDISNRSEGPDTDRADTAGVGSSKVLNAKLRRLYRSMNVAVPRPLPSLVELMGASKRPRVSSQFHL
uniref:DNA repair metallo-beta-lactamase domain-containing protein n=3 Tax=Triticum urartu TaxID=4572 RepID=A0A8R7R252_TRIUA